MIDFECPQCGKKIGPAVANGVYFASGLFFLGGFLVIPLLFRLWPGLTYTEALPWGVAAAALLVAGVRVSKTGEPRVSFKWVMFAMVPYVIAIRWGEFVARAKELGEKGYGLEHIFLGIRDPTLYDNLGWGLGAYFGCSFSALIVGYVCGFGGFVVWSGLVAVGKRVARKKTLV